MLEDYLSYRDERAWHLAQRFKKGQFFYLREHTQEEYDAELKTLLDKVNNTLLFEHEGKLWTYSGVAYKVAQQFGDTVVPLKEYPAFQPLEYKNKPKHPPRPYQLEALELLKAAKHGAVEIGTGLGKSYIIELLLKDIGLSAVVMAPSISIADQLYEQLVDRFGKKLVGRYYDSKKEYNHHIVVASCQGLAKIDRADPAYKVLRSKQVFISDESHQCPANTLTKVCFDLMAPAPYRFFFSGTQIRNDGLGMLLEAITGKIVYYMTVEQGVEQGYLAKPNFKMIGCHSKSTYKNPDPMRMVKKHLYYNDQVNDIAAQMTNNFVNLGIPVLLLVDEIEQFAHLLKRFKYPVRFAHGPLVKKQKDLLEEKYQKSDPKGLVKAFNAHEFPILVGTSCVSIGTDFGDLGAIIYLRGGTSEIEVKQGIGRGTRIPPGSPKREFFFVDFDVSNIEGQHRHALARSKLMKSVYPNYKYLSMAK